MEILIIGNGHDEVVEKLRELISDHDDIDLYMFDEKESYELKAGGLPVLSFGRRAVVEHELWSGIKGFVKNNIILVNDSPWDSFLKKKPSIDDLIVKFEAIPIKIERYIQDRELEYGYTHTFGKQLHIKRELDINNTNRLSNSHNSRSRSILKINRYNKKPLISRKHGMDNRS
jgi:hypothetical protein